MRHAKRSSIRQRLAPAAAVLLVAVISWRRGAFAGGPWRVMSNGAAMLWPGTAPVPIACDVDAGGLGMLNHAGAEALLQQALGVWNAVGPVNLSIDIANPIPGPGGDVNATGYGDTNPGHYSNFWNRSNALPGRSAIKVVFDSDGAIIDDLYGEGARDDILGLALIDTPTTCPPPPPYTPSPIEEATIIINGTQWDGVQPDFPSTADLKGIMVHEIGHALNLGHSALNVDLSDDGDRDNDRYIPVMFPLVTSTSELAALKPDDTAALLGLYGGSGNSIEGSILKSTAPLVYWQGAQVTVRSADPSPPAPPHADLAQAFSAVSGSYSIPTCGLPPDPALAGSWKITGLPPGNYTICVEQIDTAFSDANASLVGPVATPRLLEGPEECYNGAAESASAATDDPDEATQVLVSGAVSGKDIIFNGQPADDPSEPNNSLGAATDLGPGPVNTVRGLIGPSAAPGDRDFFRIAVSPGDKVRIDVDAVELGYATDAVLALWNGAGAPVMSGTVQLGSDDATDPDTGQLSRDPYLEWTVPASFASPLKIGLSCYPDTGIAGCVTGTALPYWLRVEVRPDADGDGTPNATDVCSNDPFDDVDRDLQCVADGDRCPSIYGPGSANDSDSDGIANECDNCPQIYNLSQANADGDFFGDACDACTDTDSDGFGNPGYSANTCTIDNCPSFPNTSQADPDTDGLGTPCDPCPSNHLNTCLDVTAPTVTFTFPGSGMTGISTSSDILIFLSENADPDSVDASTVFLEGPAGKVSATVRISEAGEITLDPVSSLSTSTTYTLRLRPPLRDLSGNQLAAPYATTFTTRSSSDVVATAGLGGFSLGGATSHDSAGASVALLGDVNGDGFDDYAYGSPGADTPNPPNPLILGAGRVTLVLGGSSALSSAPVRIEFRGGLGGQGVGGAVADAGDLDGDGLHDLAFSAPQSGSGTVWVVYGDTGWSTFPAGTTFIRLDTPTLGNCVRPPMGADYFCGTVFTAAAGDKAGASISRVADLGPGAPAPPPPMHDGIGELVIGAPGTDFAGRVDAGAAYLVFGGASLRAQTIALANVGTSVPGVIFLGENTSDAAGQSVSVWSDPALGGADDLLIAAPLADVKERDGTLMADAGVVYAIHPDAALSPATELAYVGRATPPTVSGVVLLGTSASGEFGESVSGATDVDGDGIADIFISSRGVVYVLDGDDGKGAVTDGSSGRGDVGGAGVRQIGSSDIFHDFGATQFYQAETGTQRAMVVAGGGDLNGDGYGDFLIGDPHADGDVGRTYIVYGRPGGWPESVSMLDVGITVPGLCINCPQGGGQGPTIELAGSLGLFGSSLSAGRDVNHDCLAEALVGAPGGGNGNLFLFDTTGAPTPPAHRDADGDGVDACTDCNDTNPLVHPGQAEVCDGLDNNCNGLVDDIPGAADADGDGRNSCIDCNDNLASVYPGHPETCDGLDNDCNGLVDDLADVDGDGYSTCTDCNDSSYSIHPGAPEACDGVDNDCDGLTDEVADLGTTTCGQGVCNHTINNCAGGVPQTCNPLQGSGSETCDGLDNDCDGATDEGLGTTTCGLGVCNHTVNNCVGGVPQSCNPMQGASPETCDGLDNDCDGSTDEVADLGTTTCGLGVCNHTINNCAGGVTQSCNPLQGASPESCDGLDNDCDGFSDEDGDGDGFGVCADCNDTLVGSFATPGEVRNLHFNSLTALAWDPPLSPGGSAIRYDTVRAGSATGFLGAGTCLETNDGSDTLATEVATPALNTVFFYLIRGENDCAAGQGPLGNASNGTPRQALNCP